MLTVQEAATQVRLTQWAIYRAIRRGDLVAYKPGGRLRIAEEHLQAWLDATLVSPVAPAPRRPAQPVAPPPALVGSSRGQCRRYASRPRAGNETEAIGNLSVHPERAGDGKTVYRVRWREGGRGTANRNRTFDHEDDAIAFDLRVRRLKQTGDPAILADEITLRQYVHEEWWPNYAERRLALSTQEGHSIDLELRIIPRLGHLPPRFDLPSSSASWQTSSATGPGERRSSARSRSSRA
jgi:excisionase family DNA binding protein